MGVNAPACVCATAGSGCVLTSARHDDIIPTSQEDNAVRVQVKLFAMLREQAGRSELELEVPPGTTVIALLDYVLPSGERVRRLPPSMLYAVNQQYAPPDKVLEDGDEVAFVPPVSGG